MCLKKNIYEAIDTDDDDDDDEGEEEDEEEEEEEEKDDTDKYRIQYIVREKIRDQIKLETGEIELLASIFLCEVLMIEAEEQSKEIEDKPHVIDPNLRTTVGKYNGGARGVNVLGMYGGRPLFGNSEKKSVEREKSEHKGYRNISIYNSDIIGILSNIQKYLAPPIFTGRSTWWNFPQYTRNSETNYYLPIS
tara:strand:- start:625 stop:1200 length:576 start_codon:yes stop_codon:yes gene_type:complete